MAIAAMGIFLVGGVYAMPSQPTYVTVTNTIIQAPPTTSEDSVVKVEREDEVHGSGVHIGDGLIITAAHVTKGAGKVAIKSASGESGAATVLWANTDYDIALLRTDLKIAGASKLDCRTAVLGEQVQSSGNPSQLEFVSSFGRIAGGARELKPWKTVLITDVTMVMGQSGGPLFEADGRVIGINVGVMPITSKVGEDDKGNDIFATSITGYGTAVPSSAVCLLLAKESAQ
ncbi:trypsin-like peptidase domain-containing protein [Rhizobium laguerreae]|uniref:S1 family peptidase n=1 Tax=Rhizobium laguerreae TaxID=1076926 RepID=UPI001C9216C1|nr:serine protease [Rhizobium laguerreae]MBY3263890.1 trypsin-like peptidase domain-containing protein [Rhizobium laguerreae]